MSDKIKDKSKQDHVAPLNAKEELSEFFKTAVIAVVLALLIRSFLYEPFNIPSGSMKPTLEVGDYLFVHKPSYGYSRYSFPFGIAPIEGRTGDSTPQRGDVIVFKLPSDKSTDYIKRVIALPSERVQMKRGRLYINDELIHREPLGLRKISNDYGQIITKTEYLETLPGGATHLIYELSDHEILDNTPVYTVPEGHYFVMGDNRDSSQDSRVTYSVGPIALDLIVGRADFIFFSTNGHARIYEIWKWPWSIRYSRLFNSIDPVRLPEEAEVIEGNKAP